MIQWKQIIQLWLVVTSSMLFLGHGTGRSLAAGLQQTNGTRDENVTFQDGEITLAGTLILPDTDGTHPAVIIVHGAHPNEREPYHDFAKYVFARFGVAALIYDKRGSGQSTGGSYEHSFEELAADALAAVRYLQSRPDIDPQRIGMEGDSQAGWLIPMVASQAKEIAFMVMVSASGVSPAQQEIFSIETRLRDGGQSERAIDAGRKAQMLLNDYASEVDQGKLPTTEELAASTSRLHNPVPVLEQITQPVLILLGEADARVPTEYSATVFGKAFRKAGNQDYTIIVYPKANHYIEVPTTDAQGTITWKRIDDFENIITTWVLAHVNGDAQPGKGIQGNSSDEFAVFGDSGNYGKPSWFGTAGVQLRLIVLFALVFFLATIGFTVSAILSRARKNKSVPLPLVARRARLLGINSSVLNLVLLVGVLAFILEMLSNGGEEIHLSILFKLMPLLSIFAILLSLGLVGLAAFAWKNKFWSLGGRVAYSVVALVALLFVPFLIYWNF